MSDFGTDATRRGFLKAGAGAVAASATVETALAYQEDGRETTVLVRRDGHGVPHVYAREADGKGPVFYGYGYAAAEDRLFQLEMYRRYYHGTVAAVLGPGEEDRWIEFDRQARVNRSGSNVERQTEERLDDVHREVLEAFAAGINRYIETVESTDERFHKGFVDNGFEPDRWTREDVAGAFVASMSFFMGVQLETFGAQLLSMLQEEHDEETAMALFSDIQWGEDPGAPTSGAATTAGYTPPYAPAGGDSRDGDGRARPGSPAVGDASARTQAGGWSHAGDYRIPADPGGAHEAMVEHWRVQAEGLDALDLPIKLGSNALAVHADRTESGDALLYGGPQMGFSSPSVMHEVGLHGPDFDVTGSTVAGYPFVMFGHNNHGALTSTAGLDNSIQTFVETVREAADGDGYEHQFRGEWYPVESTTETIPVAGAEDAEVTVRRTRHGVVVNWDPDNGEAVAMTRSYEGRAMTSFRAFFDTQFASDVEEFREAALQGDYSINLLWAGESGDVGYFHLGRYPDWASVEWDTRLPADGTQYDLSEEDYLRAADEEVPSAINPDRGYVAQWNNKPAPDWNNGDLSFAWGTDHRVQRIVNLTERRLEEAGAVSYEFMKEVVHDIAFVDLRAIRYRDALVSALEGADLSETEQAAADAVREWSNVRQGSGADDMGDYPVGYTVFDAFFPTLLAETFEPTYGEAFRAGRGTFFNYRYGRPLLMRALHPEEAALEPAVDYFEGDPEGTLRSAFRDAVAGLREEFGTDDVSQWRRQARVDGLDNLALFGMPIGVGDAGDMPFVNRGTENHFVRLGGDGGPGFRAENVLPPGNSGYVAPDGTQDEHYADQLEAFVAFEYKRLRFSRSEVARGTESLTTLRTDGDG